MGSLRLWRRIRIAPGVTINVSKGGISTSLGVRGAHVTFNKHGVRKTVGLPGSGIFYSDFQRYDTAPQAPQNTQYPPANLGVSRDLIAGIISGVLLAVFLIWLFS